MLFMARVHTHTTRVLCGYDLPRRLKFGIKQRIAMLYVMQVNSLQMDISAGKHAHSQELKQCGEVTAVLREHALHLEKQLQILSRADDSVLRKKETNRLLQQSGLVAAEVITAQDEDEQRQTRGT
jgi:hypothetical protein